LIISRKGKVDKIFKYYLQTLGYGEGVGSTKNKLNDLNSFFSEKTNDESRKSTSNLLSPFAKTHGSDKNNKNNYESNYVFSNRFSNPEPLTYGNKDFSTSRNLFGSNANKNSLFKTNKIIRELDLLS
jgi:hypothetical protein